jgi:Myb-like DNA-binding domain
MDEDKMLTYLAMSSSPNFINSNGSSITRICWRSISEKIPGRTSKQCRERWVHYLCPDVNRSAFSLVEDSCLMKLFKVHGHHWAKIAQEMPGRTENQIRYRVEYLSKLPSSRHVQAKTHIPRMRDGLLTSNGGLSLNLDRMSCQSSPCCTSDSRSSWNDKVSLALGPATAAPISPVSPFDVHAYADHCSPRCLSVSESSSIDSQSESHSLSHGNDWDLDDDTLDMLEILFL